jgi:hypothetical protein
MLVRQIASRLTEHGSPKEGKLILSKEIRALISGAIKPKPTRRNRGRCHVTAISSERSSMEGQERRDNSLFEFSSELRT